VSNIHDKVTEEDIRPVFSAFGEILSLEIKKDHRAKSKGYGFVEFKKEIDAMGAMQQLNDLEILGQKIKVAAADGQSHSSSQNQSQSTEGGNHHRRDGGIGGNYGHRDQGGNHSMPTTKISDDVGNGGMALSTADKLALMQKLGRGTVTTGSHPQINTSQGASAAAMAAMAGRSGHLGHGLHGLPPHIQPPAQYSSFNNNSRSRCVVLANMFNIATETDPDFDMEIREDVRAEVGKFGTLVHIYVDKTAREGLVYLKFQGVEEATRTINALNGRWFAKNQIKATYSEESVYNRQFKL